MSKQNEHLSMEQKKGQRVKWLTQALLLSGALNIGFLVTFIYFVLQEKNVQIILANKPADELLPVTNQELLHFYSQLSFQELVLCLEDRELVEEGFLKRDLALSSLVGFHHFDIEKALGRSPFQTRKIALSSKDGEESITLLIFPGLTDSEYDAMVGYAKKVKWPLTSRGLFYEIQRAHLPIDPDLAETFFLTKEFETVSLLFSRGSYPVPREKILELLLEGNWSMLENFVAQQRKAQDLTPSNRVIFLLNYLRHRSTVAANLLLQTDFIFVCKRIDDAHAVLLLDLLANNPPLAEKLAKVLLISPRSDSVWKRAAAKLYELAGEEFQMPFNREQALKRFIPQALAKQKIAPSPVVPVPEKTPSPPAKRMHRVEAGESLWKISRTYRVSIEEIMQKNQLTSDKLFPGMELVI